jgi:hypothetical protein
VLWKRTQWYVIQNQFVFIQHQQGWCCGYLKTWNIPRIGKPNLLDAQMNLTPFSISKTPNQSGKRNMAGKYVETPGIAAHNVAGKSKRSEFWET